MKHRYYIADVFTDQPFSGNQLAVFPEAQGIPARAMQAIAREFNFPETTFVLPPRAPEHTAQVRIFNPKAEMQFAGHPTVGTAAVLAHHRGFSGKMVLEEGIGPVPVELSRRGALVHASFTIETPPEIADERVDRAAAAAAISLPRDDVTDAWFAASGVRFCFARIKSRDAVDRAVLDRTPWLARFAKAWSANMYLFSEDGERLYVRMFAPAFGIEEDPATGSGAVALAGVLAARRKEADGVFAWHIDQGVAMGRPSRLEASAEKKGGRVVRIKVGGGTVIAAEGTLSVPDA
jgi:trans-2,3-dihydro-3-hydroxyanthranilate isomerase